MKAVCKTQNKQCYSTRGIAIRAVLSYSRKRGTALRVYWHKDCASYHITSTSRAAVSA